MLSEEYKEVFLSKTHYPALGLTYLAVSENFQRQGWGKWIVEVIVEKARSQTFAGCSRHYIIKIIAILWQSEFTSASLT